MDVNRKRNSGHVQVASPFITAQEKCKKKHWKAGHKQDCKAHWIESFFPNLRNPNKLVEKTRYVGPYLE